jgi:hypothetical protein
MDALELGDKILSVDALTGMPRFEEVYLFGHKDSTMSMDYVTLSISCPSGTLTDGSNSTTLELTAGHFLPTSQKGYSNWNGHHFVPASRVRSGMGVWVMGLDGVVLCHVEGVQVSPRMGLFNPYTRNGLLVVNQVVASAHSDWFLEPFVPLKYEHFIPIMYQAILAPVRALYNMLGRVKAQRIQEEWGFVELIARGDAKPFGSWLQAKVVDH